MANRYFGGVVKSFMVDKAIPRRVKIITITIMWISALLTSLFLVRQWWIIAILLPVSIGVTWHILSFPTKKTTRIRSE